MENDARITDFSKCSQSQSFASILIILTCTDVQWLNECIYADNMKLKYVKMCYDSMREA